MLLDHYWGIGCLEAERPGGKSENPVIETKNMKINILDEEINSINTKNKLHIKSIHIKIYVYIYYIYISLTLPQSYRVEM